MKPISHKKPENQQDVRRDDERKTRKCLLCKAPLLSEWEGKRFCHKCKSKKEWRSGYVYLSDTISSNSLHKDV